MEYSNRDQSEFNSAFAYLNRINELFIAIDSSAMAMNLNGWFQALTALFRELSTELKADELDKKNKELKYLMDDIDRLNTTQARTGQKKIPHELYWRIHNFELFLRKIMKESGLQQKMLDDATKALR